MFPQEFIDKIKDDISLIKLVEEYTDLKKIGPYTYQGHCPHPDHKDSTPSFRVFLKGYKSGDKVNNFDSWACMGCHNGKKNEQSKLYTNYGSDSIAFIQWIEPSQKKWRDAVLYLAKKNYIPIPTDENEAVYNSNKLIANSLMYNLQGESFKYLQDRGLTLQDCDNWYIGFDGKKITFPLLDKYKNVLGFIRRWLHVPEGSNDKYRNSSNSKIFNKSMYLYGIHNLDNDFGEIRITEGPMDVIMANKYKAKNVMATLGTAFTDGHIEMIKHYKKTPVFCMDGDPAGLISINKAIEALSHVGIYSKVLILPQGKDLCEMSIELGEGIEEYISTNSITYGSYILKDIFSSYTSKLNELKLMYISDLSKLINFVPSANEKTVLKSHIRNTMGIDI